MGNNFRIYNFSSQIQTIQRLFKTFVQLFKGSYQFLIAYGRQTKTKELIKNKINSGNSVFDCLFLNSCNVNYKIQVLFKDKSFELTYPVDFQALKTK